VWADTTFEDFDADAFNEAVRDGRMVGTNGPVLDVVVRSEGGDEVRGGLRPLTPEAGDVLVIRVAAAPWVPVDEVRVVVDGTVARTYTAELSHPADLFGSDGLERLEVELPLSDLSQGSGDHWIVVEAGAALPEAADLSCDGLPDTGDNNGDGSIDWRDVEELEEEPDDPCLESTGPLLAPRAATDRGSAMYWFQSVVPLGYPASFTNPFLLDADGDGYEGVGR